jgi:hypothetical protein
MPNAIRWTLKPPLSVTQITLEAKSWKKEVAINPAAANLTLASACLRCGKGLPRPIPGLGISAR